VEDPPGSGNFIYYVRGDGTASVPGPLPPSNSPTRYSLNLVVEVADPGSPSGWRHVKAVQNNGFTPGGNVNITSGDVVVPTPSAGGTVYRVTVSGTYQQFGPGGGVFNFTKSQVTVTVMP
jgi:hypothetical protein